MIRLALAVVALFALAANAASSSAAPVAMYQPATGGIIFEDVTAIRGLRIESANALLISGQMTTLDGAAAGPFSFVNDTAPNFLEWGNLLGMTFTSSFAGHIFPTGLTQAQLDDADNFVFRYRNNVQVLLGQIVRVPEPGAAALVGVALLGVAMMRRGLRNAAAL